MLALGAVAVGMTSEGREIPAGVTAVAFGVFAAALLAAGAGNAWAGVGHPPPRRLPGAWQRSGSPSPTSSSCRSAPRSASTRSGFSCTTKRGRCFVKETASWDLRAGLTATWTISKKTSLGLDENVARRSGVRARMDHGAGAAADRAREPLRPLSRPAVDDRVRRALRAVVRRTLDSAPRLADLVHPHPAALGGPLAAADVKAYQGERFKLPFAGDIAEAALLSLASRPAGAP